MTRKVTLDDLLRAHGADPGCAAGAEMVDQYVELELAGEDPAAHFPGLAAHLRSCPACRLDHDGVLDAVRAET